MSGKSTQVFLALLRPEHRRRRNLTVWFHALEIAVSDSVAKCIFPAVEGAGGRTRIYDTTCQLSFVLFFLERARNSAAAAKNMLRCSAAALV